MSEQDKTERLKQIEELLLSNNKGWTRTELADHFGVDRSTIKRNIDYVLAKGIFPIYLLSNKIYINTDSYLSNIQMNMHEMLALHLATRLLVKKSSFASRHYASLLRKISQSFANHSQLISRYMGDTADGLNELEMTKEHYKRMDRLELMNQAWTQQNMVEIDYQGRSGLKTYQLGIYCFEPYSEGLSLHVIGLCRNESRPRDFKFERILSVRILKETYLIPDDFRPHDYFRDSWGIWTTGLPPVKVRLRFLTPSAVARMKENSWHISEKSEVQEDGSLIWTANISQPVEMLPWIRSWGDQVEVLEPMGLLDYGEI